MAKADAALGETFAGPRRHRLIGPLFFAGAGFLSLLVLRFLPDWAGLGGAMLVFGLAAVLGTRSRTRIDETLPEVLWDMEG